MTPVNRRDFLKLATDGLLAACGLLGLGSLGRFLNFSAAPPPKTRFDLGPAAAYPVGSRTVIAEIPALLTHTPTGFTALSLVCPHLGCTVKPHKTGFECPCHKSAFTPDGSRQRGPAASGLAALRLELTPDGKIIILL